MKQAGLPRPVRNLNVTATLELGIANLAFAVDPISNILSPVDILHYVCISFDKNHPVHLRNKPTGIVQYRPIAGRRSARKCR